MAIQVIQMLIRCWIVLFTGFTLISQTVVRVAAISQVIGYRRPASVVHRLVVGNVIGSNLGPTLPYN